MKVKNPVALPFTQWPLLVLILFLFSSCGYEPIEPIEEIEYSPVCSPVSFKVTDDHFWFVQITDIEQTRGSGTELFGYSIKDRNNYENFLRHLRYIRNFVNPEFVVATGDLVYGGILEQVPEQWQDYRQAVRGACFDQDNYHDLPGNHDVLYAQDFDYYLKYSISGSLHHDWTIENSAGRFAFAAFNTSRPGYHEGFFEKDEQKWLSKTLDDYQDYDYRVVFAHHNLPWDEHSNLYSKDGVLREQNVNGFFGGHVHREGEQNHDGLVNVQTRQMYDTATASIDGVFRIVSFDGLNFASASKYIYNHGPQVMITSPQDRLYQTTVNPEGHLLSGKTTVRAMAFYLEDQPDLVAYIGAEGPFPMKAVDDNRYELEVNFDQIEPGQNTIRVMAEGYNDKTNPVDSIEVEVL